MAKTRNRNLKKYRKRTFKRKSKSRLGGFKRQSRRVSRRNKRNRTVRFRRRGRRGRRGAGKLMYDAPAWAIEQDKILPENVVKRILGKLTMPVAGTTVLDYIEANLDAGIIDIDNKLERDNSTMLIIASKDNALLPLVNLLLEKGADKDLQDIDGDSALMHASKTGGPAIVKLLLEAGADQTLTNKEGQTAQQIANPDPDARAARTAAGTPNFGDLKFEIEKELGLSHELNAPDLIAQAKQRLSIETEDYEAINQANKKFGLAPIKPPPLKQQLLMLYTIIQERKRADLLAVVPAVPAVAAALPPNTIYRAAT